MYICCWPCLPLSSMYFFFFHNFLWWSFTLFNAKMIVQNRMTNCVDPDDTHHNELSHLAQHCLQWFVIEPSNTVYNFTLSADGKVCFHLCADGKVCSTIHRMFGIMNVAAWYQTFFKRWSILSPSCQDLSSVSRQKWDLTELWLVVTERDMHCPC